MRKLLAICLSGLFLVMAGCQGDATTTGPLAAPAFSSSGDDDSEIIVVELRGTATGVTQEIDDTEMLCFTVDMVELESGEVIGEGTDCLDLASIVGGAGGAFALSNTTFFNFDDYGTIKSQNRTTISPVVEGSPGLTHLTGDLPDADNILSGTDEFEDIEGTARLSGLVDLTNFPTTMTLNCIFVLTFDDEDEDD